MFDHLHLLLIGATVGLLVQACRRTMAGSLTLGAVICLVAAVVILSVRNRSLQASMEEERHLSLKSLDGMTAELEACKQDVEKKKTSIADLGEINQQLEEAKKKSEKDIEGLKSELANKDLLGSTVEELRADLTSMSGRAEKAQSELDSAHQLVSDLSAEKAVLQKQLDDTLKKLAVAEAAVASAKKAAPNLPVVPAHVPANPPVQEGVPVAAVPAPQAEQVAAPVVQAPEQEQQE